jgi:hypothetical protein
MRAVLICYYCGLRLCLPIARAPPEAPERADSGADGALVGLCVAFGALFVLMVVCAAPRGKSARGFGLGHMPLMSFAAEYETHT